MAADLTPRFRRIRSMGELRVRRRGHGPFQATRLWNSIIQALKRDVDVKNRRQHLRNYSSCFTGADAVDVVLCHLMQNMYLSSHDISRNKGVQLCQALMDHKVFVPVCSKLFKSESDLVFEDSNSHFYRFIESKNSENNSGKERLSRSGHASTIYNPSALDTANEKLNHLLHGICDHPNAHENPALNKPASTVSQKDIENVWKQQVMVRLLQLIHIPVLEDILEPPVKTEHKTHFSDLVVSNTFLDREILQTLHLPKLDRWLASAVECLEYFPDQEIVMLSQQLPPSNNPNEDLDLYKKMLYEVIAKYYTQERELFFDSRLLKILLAIVELLECSKQSQALEAIQLFLRLLEPNAREELRRLVTFMAMAADTRHCKLQKQFDNKSVVSRTLTKVLLPNPAMSRAQSEQFVVFLLENYHELFKTPLALLDLISTKLRSLHNGDDPDAFSGFTFCHRSTLDEFEKQRFYYTDKELQHLIEMISRHQPFPEKKKKKMMKDFQKYHPASVNKRFLI